MWALLMSAVKNWRFFWGGDRVSKWWNKISLSYFGCQLYFADNKMRALFGHFVDDVDVQGLCCSGDGGTFVVVQP